MTKKPRTLLFVGLLILAIGAFLSFGPELGTRGADPLIERMCQEQLKNMGTGSDDVLKKCHDADFSVAIAKQDMRAVADAMSAISRANYRNHMIGYVLLGMGILLTLAGILLPILRKKD